MKTWSLVALLMLGLIACEKEKSAQPAPGQKITQLETGNEGNMRFTYNAAGQLVKAVITDEDLTNGDEITFDIVYGTNGKMREVRKSDGQTIKPQYVDNEMVKAELFEANELIGFTEYGYLNGHLKQAEVKLMDGNTPKPLMKFVLTYNAQQQPVKSSLWFTDMQTGTLVPSGHVDISYDNRVNPLKHLSDFMLLLLQLPSNNNILQEKQYDKTGALEEVRDFTYSYNSNNMPTTAQVKTTAGTQVSTTNLRYSY